MSMEPGAAEIASPQTAEEVAAITGRSPLRIAWDRLRTDPVAIICMLVIALIVLLTAFAPLVCKIFGVEYTGQGIRTRYLYSMGVDTGWPRIGPPFNGFTWDAPLGIQPQTGRDLLAMWLYGGRTSLLIATIATVGSTVIGVVVGLVAGFATGIFDTIVNFIIDLFLSFPFILGALALSATILANPTFARNEQLLGRASFFVVVGVLTAFGWMGLARLVRGEVLALREREFVQASQVLGAGRGRILFKEVLPNLAAPIIISISLGLPAYVSAEAALSFLGIGLQGSAQSWGKTVNSAQGYFDTYPLYLWAPVIGIMVLVLALNLLGDAVRDALDPKTRR